MSEPDIDLVTSEINSHAGRIDRAAEYVREAKGAGAQSTLSHESVGKINAWLPPLIMQFFGSQDEAVGTIGKAAEELTSFAERLRTLAHNDQVTDELSANRLGG